MTKLAGFIVLGAIILLLAGDLFIVMTYGYDASISVFMYNLSKDFPIALLLIGIVMGHLFWPVTGDKKDK